MFIRSCKRVRGGGRTDADRRGPKGPSSLQRGVDNGTTSSTPHPPMGFEESGSLSSLFQPIAPQSTVPEDTGDDARGLIQGRMASTSDILEDQSEWSHNTAEPKEDDNMEDTADELPSQSAFFSHGRSGPLTASTKSQVSIFHQSSSSVTAALIPQERIRNSLDDLTIDKLNLHTLGLFGRDLEIQLLQKALPQHTIQSANNHNHNHTQSTTSTISSSTTSSGSGSSKESYYPPRCMIISGKSGTGKTALVRHALQEPVEAAGGWLVEGKYSARQRDEPFLGIRGMCGQICGNVLPLEHQQPVIFQQIQQACQSPKIIPQWNQLLQFAPVLQEIAGPHETAVLQQQQYSTKSTKQQQQQQQQQQQHPLSSHDSTDDSPIPPPPPPLEQRSSTQSAAALDPHDSAFPLAFLQFIQLISQHIQPLILVLDDLQWADAATFDLMEILLHDFTCRKQGVVVVGIHRTLEKDNTNENSSNNPALEQFLWHMQQLALEGDSQSATAVAKSLDLLFDDDDDENDEQDSPPRSSRREAALSDSDGEGIKSVSTPQTTTRNSRRSIVLQPSAAKASTSSNSRSGDPSSSPANAPLQLTEVELHNLDLAAVDRLIQHLLSTDNNATQTTSSLAQLCWNKTHGNAFFLLQYLQVLQESKMLTFNLGGLAWQWNEEEIAATTRSTENVVEMLQHKMQYETNVGILRLAACLGSTFDFETLSLVWNKQPSAKEEQDFLLGEHLQEFVQCGYMTELGSYTGGFLSGASSSRRRYRWSHDSIQEAAIALVPVEQQPTFYRETALLLASQMDERQLQDSIFVVCNLLNKGAPPKLSKERWSMADMNRQACQKAMTLSAFEIAASYAAKGIALLPVNEDECWTDDPQLAVDLYSLGAKAEGALGNTSTMEQYVDSVLQRRELDEKDKLSAYYTLIDNIFNRGNVQQAMDMCLEVLRKFKCNFPRNSIQIGYEVAVQVLKIKTNLKHRKDVDSLKELFDPTRILLFRLLDKLTTCCFFAQDERLPLVIFRGLTWSLKYGVCEYSPPVFATVSMILTGVVKDFSAGAEYGQDAYRLMERTKSSGGVTDSRTSIVLYGHTFTWSRSIRLCLKPLFDGYDIGLRHGDTENAGWCIFLYIMGKFMLGSPIQPMMDDLKAYARQMKELKRDIVVAYSHMMYQALSNCTGRENDTDPTRLSGECLSAEKCQEYSKDVSLRDGFLQWSGFLQTLFGKHEQVAETVLQVGHDYLEKAKPAAMTIMWDSFLKGLSCLVAAQETGNKKYAKVGIAIRNKIKQWADQGNPNVKHYVVLLDAELSALNNNLPNAVRHYQYAIIMAARGGYLHDAALASERYAEFQLLRKGDEDEAEYRIGKAIGYWREWGALAKVDQLERKYPSLVPQPDQIVSIRVSNRASFSIKS